MSREIVFAYKPLSAEADTRIIELQPAPDASYPLQCRIAEICLSSEDLIDYEALSYTWGQPDFSESLLVLQDDGPTGVLMITPNLRDALKRLRLPDQERQIWVDAVCIDQQDDSDKSKQIPAMAQIYKSAWRVLVWLGKMPEGQQSLAYIKKALRFQSKDGSKIDAHKLKLAKSFQSLVRLPWFSRRWVIQEVVLAADVVMMCGSEDLPFVQLHRTMNGLLQDATMLDPKIRTVLEPLSAISKLWKTWVFGSDQKKGLRLFDLLNLFQNSGCVVEHDRVFALCGLASDCLILDKPMGEAPTHNVTIVIDYKQPVERLFRSITKQMLGYKHEPEYKSASAFTMTNPVFKEVFDAVIERCNGHYRNDLPPWTPDWCSPRRREALYNFFTCFSKPFLYDVYQEMDWEGTIHPDVRQMLQDDPLEELRGEVRCSVASVLEPFPEHPNMLKIMNWLQTMREDFLTFTTHSPIKRRLSPLQNMLCPNFNVDNSPSDKYNTNNNTAGVHPDNAWCHFLIMISVMMLAPQGTDPIKTKPLHKDPVQHQRELYKLSLGRTDINTDPKAWAHFCSIFRGRRLFSFQIGTGPNDISGVGIGPDHLAAGTCFKTDHQAVKWGKPDHTLAWDSQVEQAPALVGDVWYFTFQEFWLTGIEKLKPFW